MPVACKVSADGGSALVISTTNPTVLLQGTNSSGKPTRLKRFELQSNNTGSGQQILTLSYGFYATGTAGGTTVTAVPNDEGLTGIYTPSTTFKANTTTLGTTFTQKKSWQWNTANPFDLVDGLQELQQEIPVSKAFAFIFPAAPGSAVSVTATLTYEEFG